MSDPGYSRPSTVRFWFRATAVVLLALAAYAVVAGLDGPRWLLVAGLVLAVVAGWLVVAGFARSARTRGVPTPGEREPLASTHAADEPTGGPYCPACGKRNHADATRCASCGSALT